MSDIVYFTVAYPEDLTDEIGGCDDDGSTAGTLAIADTSDVNTRALELTVTANGKKPRAVAFDEGAVRTIRDRMTAWLEAPARRTYPSILDLSQRGAHGWHRCAPMYDPTVERWVYFDGASQPIADVRGVVEPPGAIYWLPGMVLSNETARWASTVDEAKVKALGAPAAGRHIHRFVNDVCECGERDD